MHIYIGFMILVMTLSLDYNYQKRILEFLIMQYLGVRFKFRSDLNPKPQS